MIELTLIGKNDFATIKLIPITTDPIKGFIIELVSEKPTYLLVIYIAIIDDTPTSE